jgi:hypothetical protein
MRTMIADICCFVMIAIVLTLMALDICGWDMRENLDTMIPPLLLVILSRLIGLEDRK